MAEQQADAAVGDMVENAIQDYRAAIADADAADAKLVAAKAAYEDAVVASENACGAMGAARVRLLIAAEKHRG